MPVAPEEYEPPVKDNNNERQRTRRGVELGVVKCGLGVLSCVKAALYSVLPIHMYNGSNKRCNTLDDDGLLCF